MEWARGYLYVCPYLILAMRMEREIVERAAKLEARRQMAEDQGSDDQVD